MSHLICVGTEPPNGKGWWIDPHTVMSIEEIRPPRYTDTNGLREKVVPALSVVRFFTGHVLNVYATADEIAEVVNKAVSP